MLLLAGVYPHRALDVDAFYREARRRPDARSALAAAMSYPFELETPHVESAGFYRAIKAPTGLMLIKRQVFERLAQAFPELHRPAGDSYYGFQRIGRVLQCFESLSDEAGIGMSEDVSFCRRWRSIGGEIWATFDPRVGHIGPYLFRAG